jgi:PAS domain S-box-containing protein
MRSPARVWLTVGPLALAAGGGALAAVLTSGHEENRILVSVFGLLVGWAFLVAGLIARTRRPENRTGVLLLLVGFTFFLGALGTSNHSVPYTIGIAFGAIFIAALVHLLLAYPSGRLTSRGERAFVICGYVAAFLANAAPMLFDRYPATEDCAECPDNALLITDSPTADNVLTGIFNGLGFVVLLLTVVILVRRWRGATLAARRLLGPVLIAGGWTLVFFALTIVVFPVSETAANLVGIGFVAGFVATPFVFLWGILRSRLVRLDLAPLLAEPSETPTLGETQDVLRALVRDPSLELLYWVEEASAYFDVERRRRELPGLSSDLAWTRVDSDTGPLAALIYDPVLCDEPEQIERVTAALRLRLEKDRSVRALRISEYRSRALLNAIPDTMFRLSRDGTILDVQSHDPENVVYPPEEMVGTSIYAIPSDVIATEAMEERKRLVRRAFETGEVQTQEYAVNMPAGGRRFAETRIVPSGENEFVMIVRDVTDEKLTESRNLALLEALPDSMFRLTRDGRYLDFQARDARYYRVEGESFVGMSIYDALPPAVAEGVMAAAERAFTTGAMQTVEGELEHEGEMVYAESRIVASGENEFVMIVRDVTDRITQQRQIQTQNEFLEAMGDATTGLLCNLFVDGRIGYDNVNLPLRELTGYAQYEVDGGYFWDVFVHPDDRADAERVVREVVAGGDPGEQQSRWLTKDGQELIVAWTCRAMPKVTHENRKLLISGSDVTERVRHEERIQRERDYFGALVDATPSFICVVDEQGHLGTHSLNESMSELTGYTDEEVARRSFAEVFSAPEDAAAVEATIAAVAAGGEPGEQETHWLTRDGRRVLVAWKCAPLPERESRRRFVISGSDVTERRRREEEQAALRRVAVAVASERRPEDVFQTVTEEAGRLLGGDGANMLRYDPSASEALVVGFWQRADAVQDDTVIGRRIALKDGPASIVRNTGKATRFEPEDAVKAGFRERLRAEHTSSVVTAPVLVSGRVWGAVSVSITEGSFPPGTEERIAQFTSLVATALANAEAREELHASRARIVEAGDAERRRLERNLHDGAQQRLVSLSLSLRLAQAKLSGDVHAADEILSGASVELALALEELRELARGIHPAVLTDRGLGPALESLADRTPLPVQFDQLPDDRLPPPVEAAAFYVVSEALANVTKYAEASSVSVRVAHEDGYAVVEVADDGVGGADPQGGSGLRGLSDRVAALEGRLAIVSPPGAGTRIRAEIPVD